MRAENRFSTICSLKGFEMSSKVRIVNNGGPGHQTEVTDTETGKAIPHVTDIDISISVKGVPTATLHTIMPIVDVVVDAEEKQICPVCHRIANPEIVNAEHVAHLFHDFYERLAPDYGYETRKESAVRWSHVPDNNRRLMIAVAGEVLHTLGIE